MTQTSNRLFDELAKLMTDAANVAQGVRREASTAFRSQAERWIAELDLVRREEFDVLREMASKAREENERLAARVAALEAALAGRESQDSGVGASREAPSPGVGSQDEPRAGD
jgi:BMFP domain-containing protein YqiC